MPECELCGEYEEKLYTCEKCGTKYCRYCGSTLEWFCNDCIDENDEEFEEDWKYEDEDLSESEKNISFNRRY